MFPFRDHNPSGRTPYVVIGIIIINVLVFLFQITAYGSEMALFRYYDTYAMQPAEIIRGESLLTLFTSMFMHGGFMHIFGNMLFLWIYGDNIEDQLGHVGFILFYLASGLLAAFAQIMIDPNSMIPMVGASGAISGVMGGYLLLFPKARIDIIVILIIIFKRFSLPAWGVLGFWIGLQFFNGLSSFGAEGGVAHWAHIGGFVAGVVLIYPHWRKLGGQIFWQRFEGHPPHPETTVERVTTIPIIKRGRR